MCATGPDLSAGVYLFTWQPLVAALPTSTPIPTRTVYGTQDYQAEGNSKWYAGVEVSALVRMRAHTKTCAFPYQYGAAANPARAPA